MVFLIFLPSMCIMGGIKQLISILIKWHITIQPKNNFGRNCLHSDAYSWYSAMLFCECLFLIKMILLCIKKAFSFNFFCYEYTTLPFVNGENSHSYIGWSSDFKNTAEVSQLSVKWVNLCYTQCIHFRAGILPPQLAWVTKITLYLERNHTRSPFLNELLECHYWL